MLLVVAADLARGMRLADGRTVAETRIFEQRHEWLAVAVDFTDGSSETYSFYQSITTESELSQ